MQNFDKINPLNQEDREVISDLKSTFDLGTQTIIGQDEDEIVDYLIDLMTEYNEDLKLKLKL